MTEIAKTKRWIILRGGGEIGVSEETGEKIKQQLIDQTTHNFLKIREANNRLINTADIVDVCDPQQMEERTRINQKQWKCLHDTWHTPREHCKCSEEKASLIAREEQTAKIQQGMKPLTKQEKENVNASLKKMRDGLKKSGTI